MPQSIPEKDLTDSLITLKSHYEQSLSEAETKASHLREQLSHVNALLLNQLVPRQTPIKSAEPALTLDEADAQVERLELAPAATEAIASNTPKPKASPRNSKATAETTPVSGKHSPRPLVPAYAGLKRLEAIAQFLQTTPGQDVTTAQISEGLFGTLSVADHKAERKSLNTQLYKGQSLKLWQKGTAPGTFTIGAPTTSGNAQPTTKAPVTKAKVFATTAAKRKSLTLLPAYADLTKQDAIATVLEQNLGEVLHQDTIIQMLYGDLSREDLKNERVRMDTCLRNGVKNSKWQKAPVAASYVLEITAAGAKSKSPGRKPEPSKEPKPRSEPVFEVETPATKAKAAKPKSAIAKAKALKKTARSKRSEVELVALLRKADIQI